MMISRILRFCVLFWFCLLTFILISPAVLAQEPAGTLTELTIDIWPDFDRPAVLILLTGQIDPGVALPATVTLPLPAEATLNAVARITSDNLMIDDIEFTEGPDSVTLITSDARFRVEFYIPYEQNGDQRQFTYRWLAPDLNINQMLATVQEPAAADAMTVTPEAETVTVGNDGLTYYNLPPLTAPAGEPYDIEAAYTADSDLLTVSVIPTNEPPAAIVDPPATSTAANQTAINWPLILAGAAVVLVIIVVVWQVIQNRQTRPAARRANRATGRKTAPRGDREEKPAGPPPTPAPVKAQVNFCHQCGQRAQPGDKFCRNCGTALKTG